MLKLLILTQYFPPEVGAPQNRLYELALRLQKRGIQITVLTAMPNYPQMEVYEAYRGKKYFRETMEGMEIHRSYIYVSKNKSIINRLRNYFSFVVSSIRTSFRLESRYDYLLCESPPLFLGYSAMYLSTKKDAKLIFNVSDLWPESAEKLGVVTNDLMLRLAYRLEQRLYKRSALVTGQTKGICNNINMRFPEVKTFWLPNGVDLNYYDSSKIHATNWRSETGFTDNDFILLYAGIIGIAQGLEVILKAAKELLNQGSVKFVLMGSGPEKKNLIKMKQRLSLTNVIFLDPVSKLIMPEVLKSVNAAVIPLRKLELFLGAIPSKVFESLAMHLPILLGVDGEARDLFITKGNCGLYFEPEDHMALSQGALNLAGDAALCATLGKNGRLFVTQHFDREKIVESFHERLLLLQSETNMN